MQYGVKEVSWDYKPPWLCDIPTVHAWDECPKCLRRRAEYYERKNTMPHPQMKNQPQAPVDEQSVAPTGAVQNNLPQPSTNGHLVYDDVELRTEKVEIKDRKTGELVKYLLTEATEEAAVKWRAANMQGATLIGGPNDSGPKRVQFSGGNGVGEAKPLLVSLCLYKANPDFSVPVDSFGNYDRSRRVSLPTVLSWKPLIVSGLYKKVRELTPELKENEEQEFAEESPKNSPEGTPDTSS